MACDGHEELAFKDLLRKLEAEYLRQRAVGTVHERENTALRSQLGLQSKPTKGKRSQKRLPQGCHSNALVPLYDGCPLLHGKVDPHEDGKACGAMNGLHLKQPPFACAHDSPVSMAGLEAVAEVVAGSKRAITVIGKECSDREMCDPVMSENGNVNGHSQRSALRKEEEFEVPVEKRHVRLSMEPIDNAFDDSSTNVVERLGSRGFGSVQSMVESVQSMLSEASKPQLAPIWDTTKKNKRDGPRAGWSGAANTLRHGISEHEESHSKSFTLDKSSGQTIVTNKGCIRKFVVTPNSLKRLFWDLVSMLMVSYDVVMIPIDLIFNIPKYTIVENMDILTSSFWALDMPCSFLTGFHVGGTVEMRVRAIAMNYIRGFFFLDLLVNSIEWFVLIVEWWSPGVLRGEGGGNSGSVALARLGKTVRITRIFRAFRLIRFVRLSRVIQELYGIVNNEYARLTCNVLVAFACIIVCNHYIACGWWAVGLDGISEGKPNWIEDNPSPIYSEGWDYHYFTSLHWSLTQFTPAGMEARPYNTKERIYSIVVLWFAMVAFSSFLGTITATMTQMRNLHSQSSQQEHVLRRYFKEHEVSTHLSQMIWKHLKMTQFQFRTRSDSKRKAELEVLKMIPLNLKKDLHQELYQPYVVHLPFLFRLSSFCDGQLADICDLCCSDAAFHLEDEVFHEGDEAKQMYFVASGNFKYIHHLEHVDDPKSGRKLEPSNWVSEPAIWVKWVYCGRLCALTSAEVIELKVEPLQRLIIDSSGTILLFAKSYAMRFLQHMAEARSWDTDVWRNKKGVLTQICTETADEFHDKTQMANSFSALRGATRIFESFVQTDKLADKWRSSTASFGSDSGSPTRRRCTPCCCRRRQSEEDD